MRRRSNFQRLLGWGYNHAAHVIDLQVAIGGADEQGLEFFSHLREMLYEAQFHIAEGKFDALVKRFVGLLAKHGGSCDRRFLLRSLHVDPATFFRIVQALHLCDEIIEETEFGKNPVYTLKNAE